MKIRLVPVIIMLVAGLAACLVCIVYNRNALDTVVITLVVIAIFCIIGLIAKTILQKFLVIETEESKDAADVKENKDEIEDININVEKNEDQSIKK